MYIYGEPSQDASYEQELSARTHLLSQLAMLVRISYVANIGISLMNLKCVAVWTNLSQDSEVLSTKTRTSHSHPGTRDESGGHKVQCGIESREVEKLNAYSAKQHRKQDGAYLGIRRVAEVHIQVAVIRT